MITKESFVDLQEKYEKVKKLIEEDAQFDPDTQPFFSKYQARQNLISMNALLEGLKANSQPDSATYFLLIGMQGAVKLQLGIIAIDTEEFAAGEEYLKECEKVIENNEEHREVASVALNMYNQMGILWAKRDSEEGQVYLEKGEAFYKKIMQSKISPIDYNDLFYTCYDISKLVEKDKFEKTYTLTLYYLAQVYRTQNPLRSAVYFHRLLQRQLESEEYEEIDWALNTATLSQFLMEKNGFKQARHHLSASLYMLDQHKKTLDAMVFHNEEYEAKLENFRHRSADVARCWAKYGLILMTNSRDRLMANSDIDFTSSLCTDISQLKLEDGAGVTNDDLKSFDFPTLNLEKYESQVTDNFILTIDDAKKVFLNVQQWLAKAQEYYTLDTLASDYIEIVQDHSKLYDALVFFEENPENRTKLLKRAVDLLENVLSQVNHTYYLQYCRQIWFRSGLFYSDILDIKLDKLKENEARPNPHALLKINNLVDKSTQRFQNFIDSYKNSKGELPDRVPSDVEKPFLQAYFHIGALQMRYITLDKAAQLQNTEKSYDGYKKFVDYCKKNENADKCVLAEMSVAKEMVMLLPLKIARIRNELPPLL